MGLLSRLKKASGLESVREPRVQPKDSPIMSETRQPVGAVETDGGRQEARREEKKKSPSKGPSVPQIIKLLDWEDDTDHYVVVMEHPMPCRDLYSFVKLHGGSLDEGTGRNIMRQIVHAANICSKRGVFHHDIKLENLLVNQDTMEVKLIDFGCGALMKKSAFKSFSGTRAYCPPEVIVNGRYHAKPTLVWTLGILPFAMVCGHFLTDLDLNMTSENNWIRPRLSQDCCQMSCDCLQPDPQQRLILEKMHLHDWFKVME